MWLVGKAHPETISNVQDSLAKDQHLLIEESEEQEIEIKIPESGTKNAR